MLTLGGGGHSGAGSATVKSEKMGAEKIKKKIIALLENSKSDSAIISDIMSFPVISVTPATTMLEVQNVMAVENIRGILVMDQGTIEGIIVLWDLKRIKKERQWNSPVKAFMARDVITITPATSPTQAARLMIEKDVGYLPVILDEKVIGIVTRTDILTYYYDLLPE